MSAHVRARARPGAGLGDGPLVARYSSSANDDDGGDGGDGRSLAQISRLVDL